MNIEKLLGIPGFEDFLNDLKKAESDYIEAEKEYQQSFQKMIDAREKKIKAKDNFVKEIEQKLGIKL